MTILKCASLGDCFLDLLTIKGDSTRVLTGSADNTCRLWDCETGRQIAVFETKTAVRSCGFNSSGQQGFITTDKQMGHECEIMVFDLATEGTKDISALMCH